MFLRAYLLIFAYKKNFTTGYNRLVESGLQIRISRQKFHLREFLVVFHQKDGETMGNSYHTLWYTYIYVRARVCVCVRILHLKIFNFNLHICLHMSIPRVIQPLFASSSSIGLLIILRMSTQP
jgi:hypothetical protein